MDRNKAKAELKNLREKINHHDYRYYSLNDPEISDKEYDDLMSKLKATEEKFPDLITADSPTQRVSGQVQESFKTVAHSKKMLSLDNTYSVEELRDWQARIKRALPDKKIEYVVELKIDGVSIALTYEKGVLKLGATRGDGQTGEDVTANIKTIRPIPLRLQGKQVPPLFEVRGEVYISKNEFKKINQQRKERQEGLFANPRNAAAGSLKLLDSRITAERNLLCYIHSFGNVKGLELISHWEFLQFSKKSGLRIDNNSSLCKNLEEVIDYCKKWEAKRESLDYEVDGVVVKVNSLNQQKELGSTLKSPRWAVAFKFAAHQATTVVNDIEVQVGRTGVLTPVAKLKPVECGGVTISNATLHNFDEIERLGLKVGDRVVIERAGDVIPKVIKVVKSVRSGKEKSLTMPKKCPVCKGQIVKLKEADVAYRCENPDCRAQIEKRLIHFASRNAMDIEGLGEKVVSQLVEKKIVKSIADIYNLKKDDLLKLELFKEKKAENVLKGIEQSKDRPLWKLIFGLGILFVGEKASITLADRYGDIEKFFKANEEELSSIDEIGPVMSESIVKFFKLDSTRKLIEQLKSKGLKLKEKTTKKQSALSGKSFIFTGELEKFTRSEAQQRARDLGANVVSSVSKKTDFVVAGKNPGSKHDKALKLKLKILSEQEFLELLRRS